MKEQPNSGHTKHVFDQRVDLILASLNLGLALEKIPQRCPNKPYGEFLIQAKDPENHGRLLVRVFLHNTEARICESTGIFQGCRHQIDSALACRLPKERKTNV